MEKSRGITLIALVITIIILIILAGVSVGLLLKENGILEKAKEGENKYTQASAKEKLEIVLADFQVKKLTEGTYYEEELDKKLQENGMKIEENIVTVDDWKFEIDKSVPKIVKELEKINEEKIKKYIYSYGNEFTILTGGFKAFTQGYRWRNNI